MRICKIDQKGHVKWSDGLNVICPFNAPDSLCDRDCAAFDEEPETVVVRTCCLIPIYEPTGNMLAFCKAGNFTIGKLEKK